MIIYNKLLKKMNNEELIKVVGASVTEVIYIRSGRIRMKPWKRYAKTLNFDAARKNILILKIEYT